MTAALIDPGFAPTARWFPTPANPRIERAAAEPARFGVIVAGRRSFKTEVCGKRLAVKAAIRGTRYNPTRGLVCGPTYQQMRDIWWADLKALVPRAVMAADPAEGPMILKVFNSFGGVTELHVKGMHDSRRAEGQPWDWFIMDEAGDVKPEVWPYTLRPAMADRGGWGRFLGKARLGWFQDLYRKAGERPGWGRHRWSAEQVLPPAEIEAMKGDMDPRTFALEVQAEFIALAGRVYYAFNDSVHLRAELPYNREAPLVFCFDFNVAPGTAIVVQEGQLPGVYGPGGLHQVGTKVLDEVWIPYDSNTEKVCRRLVADWGDHRGDVLAYGDYTGGARKTSQSEQGTDWAIIRSIMREHFGPRFRTKLKPNPPVKDRVNAVNSRLMNTRGEARMLVNARRAKHLKRDLDEVQWQPGTAGEIEKKPGGELTHPSDALGYYLAHEFSVRESRTNTAPVRA